MLQKPSCTAAYQEQGLYGGPQQAWSWGDWLAAYYSEANQSAFTNIVWSNGALDPWSGGVRVGVFVYMRVRVRVCVCVCARVCVCGRASAPVLMSVLCSSVQVRFHFHSCAAR